MVDVNAVWKYEMAHAEILSELAARVEFENGRKSGIFATLAAATIKNPDISVR
jgi:hypothetical protein